MLHLLGMRTGCFFSLLLEYFLQTFLRREAPSSQPHVIYARCVPNHGQPASGGAVKLAYLAKKFPDCGYRGNILYLVSSALPFLPMAWIRVAKRKGIKVVLNQNGVAYPAWADEEEQRRVNARNKEIISSADYVIYQSEFCRAAADLFVTKVNCANSVLHNPVDTSLFTPGTGERDCDVLLMGSVAQRERVRIPLEAVAAAKKKNYGWKVLIAGKFHWHGAQAEIEGWIRELSLEAEVQLLGAYTQEEAANFYQRAKVLVHLQDKDASPTVPLEAMACGTPVVGVKSGGVPELVPETCGILLPVISGWEQFYYPEVEAVLSAILRCMDHWNEYSTSARERVDRCFSLSQFIGAHEKIFSKILSGERECRK